MVEQVKARDQCRCRMCGLVTTEGEVDHVIPLCRGGKTTLGSLQYLCKPCHAAKTKREAKGVK
jgi:5-methylcytosine-specific restriction protein A